MIQIEKFRRVMEEVSAARGEFVFFGLFLREEAPDTWDLVISAPWLEAGKRKALGEFVEKVTAIAGKQELLTLSRIVTLKHDDSNLEAVLQAVHVDNGPLKLLLVALHPLQWSPGPFVEIVLDLGFAPPVLAQAMRNQGTEHYHCMTAVNDDAAIALLRWPVAQNSS